MVVVGGAHSAAKKISLRIGCRVDLLALNQDRREALGLVGLRHSFVRIIGGFRNRGIEIGGNRTDLRNSGVGGPAAAGARRNIAKTGGSLTALDALTAGNRCSLRGSAGNAGKGSAGFGALNFPCEGVGSVAGYFDIDVVFEGQRDGIADAEVKLAGANETGKAAGISGSDGRYLRGFVGPPQDRRLGAHGLDGCLLSERQRSRQRDGQH